jgi:hypothetical protein
MEYRDMTDIAEDKKTKTNFGIILPLVKICLFLLFLNPFSFQVSGQNIDSLAIDSSANVLRVKINTRDSVSRYVPMDSIGQGTLSIFTANKKKIPGRAGLLSAVLPGLGQAYNGNYWKIPIIYSLFAGMYFIGEDNNFKYLKFKEAYKIYDDGGTVPGINPALTKTDLKEYKDYYKRNRDLNVILGVLIYFMNILDASVDAHLMDYDISDDLSLRIKTDINLYHANQNNPNYSGFGLKFVLSLHK